MTDAAAVPGAAVPNRAYPYDSIVEVATGLPDGQVWTGSGVLIAPDEVLTCAHLVWRTGLGQAVRALVEPAVNGADQPYGAVAVANVHYFPIDDTNDLISADQSQHDFALLHLSQPVAAGLMPLQPNFLGGQIHVTGYPFGGGAMADLATTVQQAPGLSDLVLGQLLTPGMSGAPLWSVGADGQPYCVGVVSAGGAATGAPVTVGGEITPELLNTIQVWEAQDHAPAVAGGAAGVATGLAQSSPLPATAAAGSGPALAASIAAPLGSELLQVGGLPPI